MGFINLPDGYNDELSQMCKEFEAAKTEAKTGANRARREAAVRAKRAERTQTPAASDALDFETGVKKFLRILEKYRTDWIYINSGKCSFDRLHRNLGYAEEFDRGLKEFMQLLNTRSVKHFSIVKHPRRNSWMCAHLIYEPVTKEGD